jgi:acyl-CoA ligase (AMP-forming) (exosortase A-associated)
MNMLVGATSVATYIGNQAQDRILAILPLSFDAGLSQVTTGIYAGACVVLHNHLLPRDVVRVVENESVTGLTAVPPLWMQIADQQWPAGSADSVRYFANTGGKMPRETLATLRSIFSHAKPFLMYGLTEAFRSTYLPPAEVDRRPDSIGKAIPNAEILVVAKDGSLCGPGEVGELVHRGPLVSLGYWNDPERTAHRFRPAPGQPDGLPNPELAVWSGDSVKTDDEGFLYFVSRMDEMIKTSGYRVSPAEIEEVVYDTGLVSEVAALGIPHPRLSQAIVLVAKAKQGRDASTEVLLAQLKPQVPNYMVPQAVFWKDSLPRNANGKLDRRRLAEEYADLFDEELSN